MRRFSILSLMGVVLVLAIGFAALRNADDDWAGGLLLATSLLIGVALLGGILGEGRPRAGKLGFAILGGGYFGLAFLGLSEVNLAKLPTSWLLNHVHQRVAPPQAFIFTLTGTSVQASSGVSFTSVGSPAPNTIKVGNLASAQPTTSPVWKSLIPGAANGEAFNAVGQCLFALLAGLMGSVIARGMWAKRERQGARNPARDEAWS